MDKKESAKNKWSWLPVAMPGVAALIAEKRRTMGSDHVNECWRRGVVQCEPGWFFAREGPLALGTPWNDDPVMQNFAALNVTSTQALLILHTPTA